MKHQVICIIILTLLFLLSCENKAEFDIRRPAVAAGTLKFDIQPGGGTANSVWAQQPSLSIVDDQGQVITTGADSFALVSLGLSSGTGTLSGTTMIFAINGEVSFTDLKVDTLGTKRLTATKYGTPNSIVVSSSFNITVGAPSKIELSSAATILDPGVCHPLTVNLMDAGNNIVNAATNISISFSGLQNANLYTNSSCTTDLTTLTIPGGQSTVQFYFRDEGQENLRLTAIPHDHLISQATLSLEVNPLRFTKVFLSSSGSTLCRITTVGTAFCDMKPGMSSNGQTGYTDSDSIKVMRFDYPITEMSLSDQAACALLANGQVRCWGRSLYGIRGDGTASSSINTTPSTVILPAAATQIMFVSERSACALVNVSGVNRVYCWGDNANRSLGDLTTTNRSTPVQAQLGLTAGQTVLKIRKSVSRDRENAYAILNDGTVKTWGYNQNPETLTDINSADVTGVRDIARGRDYHCTIQLDGSVNCWGANNYGQLGDGSTVSQYVPAPVSGISNADEIYGTDSSIIVKRTNGDYYQWGRMWGFLSLTATQVTPLVRNFSTSGPSICGMSNTDTSDVICSGLEIFPELFETPSYQKLSATITPTILQRNSDCAKVETFLYNQRSIKTLTSDLVLTPTDLSNFGSFFYDSSCLNPLTQFTLPSGESSAVFYYQSSYSGTNANSSKIKIATSHVSTRSGKIGVQHKGIAHSVSFENFNFGTTCTTNVIKTIDDNSNEVAVSSNLNVTLSLDADPSIVRIYSNSSCTTENYSFVIPAGQSRVTYYTRGTDCSSSNLTATYTGLATTSSNTSFYDDCSCD